MSDVREFDVSVPKMEQEADVQRVRKALGALVGVKVKECVFDTDGRKVTVRYNSMEVAHKNIEIAIAEAGYEANGIAPVAGGK